VKAGVRPVSGTASQIGKELYEFGPFRVDAQREVLLRDGKPVPLTPKTFQILLVLVRHSQQVVTKEDLMKAVWPDTFVEEANLSRNIFMLRKALGESPEDRRYIVTVPGRGYRLAESVRLAPERKLSIVAAQHTKVQAQVAETKPWVWVVVAAGVLVAVAAVGLKFALHRSPVLTERDTLVLADFANSTGDPVFDGTLREGLAVQLEQSPFLRLISEQQVQQTLRLMDQPSDARLTPAVAREVCERSGSTAVLEGSISRLGSQYVLALRAEGCRTENALDEEQVQVARKEDVLNAISQIARKFRIRAGESLATIQEHNVPLAEATTSSLEALKVYSAAWNLAFSSGSAAAVPLVKRAIEIDPKFAMAYAYLGRLYGDIGESTLSSEAISKAYQLRDRVSDRERFFITFNYDRQVTGNLEKARETLELWAQAYPRDEGPGPHSFLSGAPSVALGRYETAVEEGTKAIELDADSPWGYSNRAAAYIFLDRLPEAQATIDPAFKLKLQTPALLVMQYEIAFLRGDKAGMDRVAAQSEGKVGAEDWIADLEGSTLAYSGHLRAARLMTHRAMDLAQEAGDQEREAQYEAGAAVREALFGNRLGASRSATAALELSKGRDVEYGAALALALAGDSTRSEALANDLEQRFPQGTLVQFNYVPTVRALAALNRGKPSNAIELLEVARPYELGFAGNDDVALIGSLYPAYVRGMAYLAQRQGAQAAGDFQKILDHRGIVFADPIGALAHLQLGRAFALGGNKAKAREAYRNFLMLWKDADPDISVLKRAKAEYAKLQ
jgi:DNA-binding winged helix-turn-helix (wHTH) protein/tetratricopeptide (TPR) repeat protein